MIESNRQITYPAIQRHLPRTNSSDWAIWVVSFRKPKRSSSSQSPVTIWGIWAIILQRLRIGSSRKSLKTNCTGRVYWKRWTDRFRSVILISPTCRWKRTAIHWIPSGATASDLHRHHLLRCRTAACYPRQCQWCRACHHLLCLHHQGAEALYLCRPILILAFSYITTVTTPQGRARRRSNSFGARSVKINWLSLKARLCGTSLKLCPSTRRNSSTCLNRDPRISS